MSTPIIFDPVKFTPLNTIFISISAIIFNVGFLLNTILIYIFFKNYHSSTSCYEKCICFLIFCQFCWSIPFSIQYPYMVSKGESFGFNGCQWMGPILQIVVGMTVIAHNILAIDRYYTIILQKPLKTKHFVILFLIFSPLMIFLIFSPLVMGTGYALNDGHFCYYNFKSRNPADLVIILTMFGTFLGIFSTIIYCYTRIYLDIAANKKSSDVKKNSTRDRLNRKIFNTCIAVVGCFTVCYTPLIVSFIVQSLFTYDFPEIITHLSTTISVCDCIITPICLFILVPSYQQGFRKHVYDYRRADTPPLKQSLKVIDQTIVKPKSVIAHTD
ncbi:hypothetical protein BC833DRAFT_625644 [Globomyces pollinis-pini]|nr:hypothetical protein BC833DRAFT_625644 [Globomyces pollinis-pini]